MTHESITITVRDDVLYGSPSDAQLLTLFFPTRTITARDLIRERVTQEVRAYNERRPELFRGLVAPSQAEKDLNGYRLIKPRAIDAEKQCRLALEAFAQNGFLLLVDDRQVAELDEPLTLRPDSSVVFLKLTPLVGG
jgi:hypothetical protein